MILRSSSLLVVAAALLLLLGLGGRNTVSAQESPGTEPLTGKVVETMDAGAYTYARVESGTKTVWAAAPKTALAVGDTVVVPAGMRMKDFTSKSLDRTFAEIYFVPSLRPPGAAQPAAAAAVAAPAAASRDNGSSPKVKALVAEIAKAADGVTIAEIHANKADLTGKPVAVRGRVTKFNGGILGKNWIHLEDDSGSDEDLTVTTDAVAKVGDTVVARGVLGGDRDFGAGYRYDVILEDAAVTVE